MSLLTFEKQYHINLDKNDVGKYVILPGDPGRVPEIAKFFDNPQFVAQNREYTTYTGYLSGVKVTAISTGIGCPSAAIAVEELVRCGCHTFIRVGTCGGMNRKVACGDIVIANAAIRGDGTSAEYLPEGYPAVADHEVTVALNAAAGKICSGKTGFHTGVVQSKDAFYGQLAPETLPCSGHLLKRWDAYIKCGCLASEMECAAIFAVAAVRNVRAGAVLAALWNTENSKDGDDKVDHNTENAIKCAVEAVKILINEENNAIL